jgi:hypothetical protein
VRKCRDYAWIGVPSVGVFVLALKSVSTGSALRGVPPTVIQQRCLRADPGTREPHKLGHHWPVFVIPTPRMAQPCGFEGHGRTWDRTKRAAEPRSSTLGRFRGMSRNFPDSRRRPQSTLGHSRRLMVWSLSGPDWRARAGARLTSAKSRSIGPRLQSKGTGRFSCSRRNCPRRQTDRSGAKRRATRPARSSVPLSCSRRSRSLVGPLRIRRPPWSPRVALQTGGCSFKPCRWGVRGERRLTACRYGAGATCCRGGAR